MRAQVVLLDGRRILLAEHSRPDDAYWVLPGGAVEPGETPEQAAMREVLEETGLRILLQRLLFVDEPRVDGAICIRRPRHTFLGEIVAGELQQPEGMSGGSDENGRLRRVDWMPVRSPLYDAQTRDTLERVIIALEGMPPFRDIC